MGGSNVGCCLVNAKLSEVEKNGNKLVASEVFNAEVNDQSGENCEKCFMKKKKSSHVILCR